MTQQTTTPTPHLDTRLTRLMGIEKPILCGGLMWLATTEYVAAGVRAGAMGYLLSLIYI